MSRPLRATWPAKCPKCGADIFFHRNEIGSRVYFDALGDPWPKHPCMDRDRVASMRANREVRESRLTLVDDASDTWTSAQLLIFEHGRSAELIGVHPAAPLVLPPGEVVFFNAGNIQYVDMEQAEVRSLHITRVDLDRLRKRLPRELAADAPARIAQSEEWCELLEIVTDRPGGATLVLRTRDGKVRGVQPAWVPGIRVGDYVSVDCTRRVLTYEGWGRDVALPISVPLTS